MILWDEPIPAEELDGVVLSAAEFAERTEVCLGGWQIVLTSNAESLPGSQSSAGSR